MKYRFLVSDLNVSYRRANVGMRSEGKLNLQFANFRRRVFRYRYFYRYRFLQLG